MKGKLTKILNIIVDVLVVFILIISVLILTMVLTTKGDAGVPNVFGKAPITVLSDSMKGDKDDCFEKGDLLLCDVVDNPAAKEYKVGDVVTFKLKGVDIDEDGQDDFVTHRIYKVNKDGTYQTKGDANTTYDQDSNANAWNNVNPVNIVAKYNGSKIGGLGNFIAYLQTSMGFFLVILLPMIIFFLYQAVRVVINIVAYSKEKTLKKAQDMINNADLTEEQKQKAIEEYLAQ
ncbi:MAG: signal peptidase I, partial [Ruminococcus sp.]|nr:signal peptidase I [Ruminococcus sp.]